MAEIKAIVFARVSTLVQDLQPQVDEIKNYALKFYSEDEIAYVEGKESAIKLAEEERATLNELKEMIDKYPTVKDIYCFALDRISRRSEVIVSVVAMLTRRGINLTFLNPQPISTMVCENGQWVENDRAKLLILFYGYTAEQEMKLKGQRFHAAKNKMRADGKLTQGIPIYGYDKAKDGTLTVNEEKAKIVRYIYKMYIEDCISLANIYQRLIDEGYWTTQARRCSYTARIRKFFTEPAYVGKHPVYSYPPIVTEEMQRKAQEIMAMRKPKHYKTKYDYYAAGLIVCHFKDGRNYHLCPVISKAAYSLSKLGEPQYRVTVAINAVDWFVWECVKIIYPLEQYAKSKVGKSDLLQRIRNVDKNIERMNVGIEGIRKKIDRANDLFIDGGIGKDKYDKKVKELNRQLAVSQNTLNVELQTKAGLETALETMGSDNLPPFGSIDSVEDDKLRIKLINEIVDEIAVTPIGDEYDIAVVAKSVLIGRYDISNYTARYKSRGGQYSLIWNGREMGKFIPRRYKST